MSGHPPWHEFGVSFGRLPEQRQQALLKDALAQLGGGWRPLGRAPWVLRCGQQVLRLQNALHEEPLVLTSFSADLDRADLPGVRTVQVERRPEGFWALQSFVGGQVKRGRAGRARRAESLISALRMLHAAGRPQGDTLADDRGIALFFGRHFGDGARYRSARSELRELVNGLPLVSIHGDVGTPHNCHFHPDDSLAGLLDPGAVRIGPALLDLACSCVWEIRHGYPVEPLLEAWSPLDPESESRFWPLLRLCIERGLGGSAQGAEQERLLTAATALPR